MFFYIIHITIIASTILLNYFNKKLDLIFQFSLFFFQHNELHNSIEKLNSEREAELNNKQMVATMENMGKDNTITTVVQVAEDAGQLAERKRLQRQFETKNTFGWARIEILTMLVVCITLASLSFSLLVEALQTLVHIDHQDSMHLPVHVMILGFVGILLNVFTYILIGGYTLHQGNFLHINPMGKVVVEPSNITLEANGLAKGHRVASDHQLKEDLKAELGKVHYHTRREGPAELLRDVSSTIFVIVCAVIVHFAKDKEHTAKFIDPVLSIFSCVLVVGLSYPYSKYNYIEISTRVSTA